MPRIVLIHAYRPSMPAIEGAFAELWPEAEVLNLLDESLYADVTADGVMAPSIPARVETLLRHAAASGADAIVFTGSTFGTVVEAARQDLGVPVLKSDEAMTAAAVARGGSVLLVCSAARAVPVIEANLLAAAAAQGKSLTLETLVVPEAKAAITRGDLVRHDELLRDAIIARPVPDTLLLGQYSMTGVRALLPPELAGRTVTGPTATVEHLRASFARTTR